MKVAKAVALGASACALSACESLNETLALASAETAAVAASSSPESLASVDLTQRYEAIRDFIGTDMYGEGGQIVLRVAYEALAQKHASGEALDVSLEDLWTHALQEGGVLFNQPERRWGQTTAAETGDMVGQTTIGPWQMTVTNIKNIYGPRYGVDPESSNSEVNEYVRERPEIQAMMISDYIQLSYDLFGRRGPYAIQRYFWLEPYVAGDIGQADDWARSPVARPAEGQTWQDVTAEQRRDTGFYAKQVLLGHPHQERGLLFWLVVTGHEDEAAAVLETWAEQPRLELAEGEHPERGVVFEEKTYVETDDIGDFLITPEDVRYPETENQDIRERVIMLVNASR